jgi:hypothetical protein
MWIFGGLFYFGFSSLKGGVNIKNKECAKERRRKKGEK